MKLRFEYFRDRRKEWRWRLVASNGRIVACAGEGYKHKGSCTRMASRIVLILRSKEGLLGAFAPAKAAPKQAEGCQ